MLSRLIDIAMYMMQLSLDEYLEKHKVIKGRSAFDFYKYHIKKIDTSDFIHQPTVHLPNGLMGEVPHPSDALSHVRQLSSFAVSLL